MDSTSTLSRREVIVSGAVSVTALVAGCLGGSGGDQGTVRATFDAGKDGWSAVDMETHGETSDPNWGEVVGTLGVTHESQGGVDDSGYIGHADDTGERAFFFSASDEFLGDMSEFVGGQLEFSLRASHNDHRKDSAVVLQGPETVVATEFDQPGSGWTAYTVSLDADARTYRESNLNGPEVDQTTVERVLSDLRAIRISGEHSSRTQETVDLDEVRLVPA